MKKITMTELQQDLTPSAVRVFQIIYFSIMFGVTLFLGIVVFLYLTGIPADTASEQAADTIRIYSLVHAALFAGGALAGGFIERRFYEEERMGAMADRADPGGGASPASIYIGIVRTAKIIRIALLEAPVFFGIVTCYIAVTSGVIRTHPYFWLNAFSTFFLIGFMAKDFPTAEKLQELFKEKLKFLFRY